MAEKKKKKKKGWKRSDFVPKYVLESVSCHKCGLKLVGNIDYDVAYLDLPVVNRKICFGCIAKM